MTAAKHGLALMAKESPLGATILNPPKKGEVHMIVQCRMNMTVWGAGLYFHVFIFLYSYVFIILYFLSTQAVLIFSVLLLTYSQLFILRIFINHIILCHKRCPYDLKTFP